jgi:hypothetical protein
MEHPESTNPLAQPSLDDDVESLLSAVKATQVEAPADRGEDAAREDGASGGASGGAGMFASDDAGDIADLLNAQTEDATHEREINANGVEPLAGAAKINGDTAAIDEQLDALTRQAAELAKMADATESGADAADVSAAAADHPVDLNSLLNDVAAEVGGAAEIDRAAESNACDVAPSDVTPSDVAPSSGLPTTAEDAAALAAEMLAKATAAVEEVTGTRVGTAMDAVPADADDVAADADAADAGLQEVVAEAQDAATPGGNDDESLDDLLANLSASAASSVASSEADLDGAGLDAAAQEVESLSPRTRPQPMDEVDEGPRQSITSLDEQIAQLSDDLLNEPSQIDTILSPGVAAQQAAAVPAVQAAVQPAAAAVVPDVVKPVMPAMAPAEVAPVMAAVASPQIAPVHAAPVHAAPVHAAPVHAAPVHAAPVHVALAAAAAPTTPAAESFEAVAAPAKPRVSLRQRLKPIFAGAGKAVGSILGVATPALAVLSAPLAKKPRIVRDSIGWIAVNTVFCASCLWGYMLFLRPADVAEQHVAFDLAHSELPEVPSHADAHGAAADGHGEAKDDGHGAKDDGHGGKGDAKADAKKAYKPPSRKPPTKAERAKAKPKEDAGGGGHH